MSTAKLHLPQTTILVCYISFIKGTNQRFVLVLLFDNPGIFFVALFILKFLMCFFRFLP